MRHIEVKEVFLSENIFLFVQKTVASVWTNVRTEVFYAENEIKNNGIAEKIQLVPE